MISPRLKGNKIYGGVDANTGLTFGFNGDSGEPMPGTKMKERDIYSVAAAALGISERLLQDWVKQHGLPCVRIGQTILYPVDEVRQWLRNRQPRGDRSGGRRGWSPWRTR